MLDRNRRIKKKPEKFQHCADRFELIITAEERVYDQLIDYMETRETVDNQPVHVVNMDIQDNHEEATLGAFLICDMVAEVRDYAISTIFRYCNFSLTVTNTDGKLIGSGQRHRRNTA